MSATVLDQDDPDRSLFMVTHQICEMWFSLILVNLCEARRALLVDDPAAAVERLRLLPVVMRTVISQFDVLSTLDAAAFEEIRRGVGSASGFQSAQFREIEFACGLRDPRLVNTTGLTTAERDRLRAWLAAESMADTVDAVVERRRSYPCDDVQRLRRVLLDFDEAVVVWRARHASLAERFVGRRTGTAGTDGTSYLWRAATGQRLFPSVWPTAA